MHPTSQADVSKRRLLVKPEDLPISVVLTTTEEEKAYILRCSKQNKLFLNKQEADQPEQ